jgi:hypothetical protein
MDTLQVEYSHHALDTDIRMIVGELVARKEWYFTLEPVEDAPGSFVAHDDRGRYIGISQGAARRFSSDIAALKVALHYNTDILKIRRSADLSWRKNGKIAHGLM